MFNPIRDEFDPINTPLDFFEINWKSLNIYRHYLIVMTGRSGSTFLTKQIKNTALCGNPEEFFNEGFVRCTKASAANNTFASYLECIAKNNSQNGYFGFEIDAQRFFWLNELINLEKLIQSDSSIPVIWLTRQDLVSQAYSFAVAKSTGVWHQLNDGSTIKSEAIKQRAINDKAIWDELLMILKWEQKIEHLFSKSKYLPLRITYEQLICDQTITISRLLSHIGMNIGEITNALKKPEESKQSTSRLQYSDKIDILTSFYSKNSKLINLISEHRRTVNIKEIENEVSSLS